MKKTIFFILAIGFATTGAFAQSSTSTPATAAKVRKAPESVAEKTQHATDKINAQAKLSVDQRSKVYDILNEYFSKLGQIKKADAGKHSPETNSKIEELKNSLMPKFQAILTADQMNVVKAMEQQPNK